ncbi:Alcohol dehydrogenase [NADP(+)] [Orchesella cincta]|uniref:Alcohol dehydrogenase [NADP(+)] n=1 Tax=Orchesella cincta TaxID=48709 RepID=A0A1D2NC07_ORCCI|nr:Alcohol dehydrogenase [NADP(+)] [Orchesella cincta]
MTNPQQDQLALEQTLNVGYRHLDTAYKYENEELLPWIGMQADKVDHFINLSLSKLQTEYIDLYLVCWPFGMNYRGDDNVTPKKDYGDLDLDLTTDLLAVWKAMERQVDVGKAKAIGVSNFNSQQIERVMKISRDGYPNLWYQVQSIINCQFLTGLQSLQKKIIITASPAPPTLCIG